MSPPSHSFSRALSDAQVRDFIELGFVRIDGAFSPHLAEEARAILWRDLGLEPDDRAGWTRPVVRLGMYAAAPFVAAACSPALVAACDRLVGRDRWLRPGSIGTFPVRFPSADDPGDDGWHVDMSYGTDAPDFMDWRVNFQSRGRALLMLFLFSDVGEDDAPTRIRAGSHRDVARMLAPAGEAGLSLRAMVDWLAETERREEIWATGPAGTVYLCHPFLVHAAQRHRGRHPRFLAQPPLLPAPGAQPGWGEGESPVELATLSSLQDS